MKIKAAQEMLDMIDLMLSSQRDAIQRAQAAKLDNQISDIYRTEKINAINSDLKAAYEKGCDHLRGTYEDFTGKIIAEDGFVVGANAGQYQNAISIMQALGNSLSVDDMTILLEPFKTSPVMHKSLQLIAHNLCPDAVAPHDTPMKSHGQPINSRAATILGVVVSDLESLIPHTMEVLEGDGIWPALLEMNIERLQNLV